MSKVLVTESHLSDIADAIRAKNGTQTEYRPGDMAAAIEALPTGGGGGDIPLLTQAQWSALTTAEKQSYGLVAIQQSNSGFNRGKLVYGADYEPVGVYLPNSDPDKVICEAYASAFDAAAETWGFGNSPVVLQSGLSPSKDTSENAVLLPVKTNGKFAYVDLGAASTPFTAYVVMKASNPDSYSRMISAFNSRGSGNGIMLFGSTINVSSWASDTSTGVSASQYFAAAIQFAGSGSAFGLVYGTNAITKSPSVAGRYVTLGRTDIDPSTSNAEPCDIYVRYVAVVGEAETQQTVAANLASLVSVFMPSA